MKYLLKSIALLACLILFSNPAVCQIRDTVLPVSKPVFSFVEKMPRFPGGDSLIMVYIKSHLIYPESAKKDKLEGIVVVQFIVDSIGNIRNPIIARGISKDCDKEALNLVNNFPKWQPGMHNNKPVSVSFTLPIKFKL